MQPTPSIQAPIPTLYSRMMSGPKTLPPLSILEKLRQTVFQESVKTKLWCKSSFDRLFYGTERFL